MTPCVRCGGDLVPGTPMLPTSIGGGMAHLACLSPCCSSHSVVDCCDPEDCGPCCSRCPTCPTVARKRAAAPPPSSDARAHGFRGPEAVAYAGITYRQLDYWCRTGLVEPSVRPAHGSGTQRLFSRDDVVKLAVSRRLLNAGMSLDMIRRSLDPLLASYATGGDPAVLTLPDGVVLHVPLAALYDVVPEPGAPQPGLTVVT